VLGHEPPYPSAVFSGRAEILTKNIGRATAAIMQRIAGMDEALAAVDRVILAITVERVSAANYIPARTEADASAADAGARGR
jgi:hypothetical protein